VGEEESHSEEEIKMIISESEEDGKINLNERELIQNVFDFDNNVIRKIMTPVNKMVCIDINETLDESLKQIIDQ
jgi:CBS domain containing-hemolysin-like protein